MSNSESQSLSSVNEKPKMHQFYHPHKCLYCECTEYHEGDCQHEIDGKLIQSNVAPRRKPVKEKIEASQVGSEKISFWRKYFPCFFSKESEQMDTKEPDVHPVKPEEGIVPVEPEVAQQSVQLVAVEPTESKPSMPIVLEQKGVDEPKLVVVKILPSNVHYIPKKEEQFPIEVQQSNSPSVMKPKVVPKVAENKLKSSNKEKQVPIEPMKTRQEINASIREKWFNAPVVIEPSLLPLSRFKPAARISPLIAVKRKGKNCLPVSMVPTPKEKEEKIAPVVDLNLPLAVVKKEEIVPTPMKKEEEIAPSVERTVSSAFVEDKKDVQVSTVEVLRPSDVPIQLISEASKVPEGQNTPPVPFVAPPIF